MKLLLFLSFILFFTSCKQTAIEEKLSDTDSVMVQFYTEDGMIYNAVTSTEKPAIKKLTSFLENKTGIPGKCVESGKVQFFSKRKLTLDATYHLFNNSCRYFSYRIDTSVYYIAMSNEAFDFLQSLRADPTAPKN